MATGLNWGILGTGRINRGLIPPLRTSERNQLVAVASRDTRRAEGYAQEWSIPRAYGSYEALLADPQVDVIYNSLPNSLHAEWTVKAARAGKHVLCEKPLAISVDEVDAIAAAARDNGVVIQEAFMYRHLPQTLKVQELIAGGALGKIWLVRGAFRFKLTREADVRLQPDLHGGSLWDVGCYPVSYARMVLQREPEEVYGWQQTGPSGVDVSFAGQLRFPGDAVAQVDSSFLTAGRTFIEIAGDAGGLNIPFPFTPRADTEIILSRGDHEEVLVFPAVDLYSGEVENMADAILDGAPPRVSLEDSRGTVAAIRALLESARLGKPVRI
jgi:predicted dehydrogenase